MRKKADRSARESTLGSGWILEGEPVAEHTPGPASPTPTPGPTSTPASVASVSTSSDGLATAVPTSRGSEPGDLAEPDDVAEEPATDARPQLSNGALVLLGVIGGLYLLYTWVWFSWASYYAQINDVVAAGSGILGGALQQVVFWFAPLAPALWFLAAYLLNRGAPTWRLAAALIAGAVVLVPLPALIIGGAS